MDESERSDPQMRREDHAVSFFCETVRIMCERVRRVAMLCRTEASLSRPSRPSRGWAVKSSESVVYVRPFGFVVTFHVSVGRDQVSFSSFHRHFGFQSISGCGRSWGPVPCFLSLYEVFLLTLTRGDVSQPPKKASSEKNSRPKESDSVDSDSTKLAACVSSLYMHMIDHDSNDTGAMA